MRAVCTSVSSPTNNNIVVAAACHLAGGTHHAFRGAATRRSIGRKIIIPPQF